MISLYQRTARETVSQAAADLHIRTLPGVGRTADIALYQPGFTVAQRIKKLEV